MSEVEAKRAARRAAMPITTAFLEQYAEFSPTLIYAQEGGITYGKKPAEENAYALPADLRVYVAPAKRGAS